MGIGQGAQNTTLFQMGVYFKKKAPEKLESETENANQDPHESRSIRRLTLDGDLFPRQERIYQYKCKDLSHVFALRPDAVSHQKIWRWKLGGISNHH